MENKNFNKNKYIFTSMPSMVIVGDVAEKSRSKQINLFLSELHLYNVIVKDLVNFKLNENERNVALNVAYYMSEDEELSRLVNNKKALPISKLAKKTRMKSIFLERWRDYILAYYIILNNPNYKAIQDYFRIKLKEPNDVIKNEGRKKENHKGIVIKSLKNSVYILTSKGEFIKLKNNSEVKAGEIAEGKQKKGISDYKIPIAITIFILFFIGCGIFIKYNRTESIVVVETTSNIKMHVNSFDKVIYIYSPTDKGKLMISNINVLNKDVDDAVTEVLKYAIDNEMLDLTKKTLVTITGKPLKYGKFSETNKFISENKIPVLINNSGNQHKLPTYIPENKGETKS